MNILLNVKPCHAEPVEAFKKSKVPLAELLWIKAFS